MGARGGGGRLVRHYFLASVILISGGLITSGFLELYFRYQESWEHFGKIQKEVAAGAAFKIENFVDEIERSIRAATKTREIVRDGLTPEYQWELRRLLVNAPSITQAIGYDLNGVKRAAARRSGAVLTKTKCDPPAPGALQSAQQGKTYIGSVYFPDGTGPYMTIAVPIERYVGEVIGVLQAEVDLKAVWEVISDIHVGKAGHAYLVARSGELIAHPDISLVLQKRNLAQLDHVKAAFQSDTRSSNSKALVTNNLLGKKVFSSYTVIPTLGWAVFTELPIQEVYAPLYASMLRTSTLLLVGLGVALLATLLVRRRVVQPIEALRQGVERISAGDLASRLELKTGDELEVLSQEFNLMATNLKDAHESQERKVIERTEALSVANQKLEDVSKHKSDFLANVNHELRTPVSAIINYSRLLLRKTEGQIPQAEREDLQDLLNNATRLQSLINSLLDLAKIEAGRMEVRAEPVQIDELIHGVASTIKTMLKQDVRLVRETASGIPPVNTDLEKLRQILLNLLGNAAKFTEQGEVKISASQENGSLKLVVSDTGIGIEKRELDYIFEEFRQGGTSKSMNHGGTGLGLAIVKRFVNLLGGDIRAESEIGKGSTFTVMLPLDQGESGPPIRKKESPA